VREPEVALSWFVRIGAPPAQRQIIQPASVKNPAMKAHTAAEGKGSDRPAASTI
jgi:hypothetical protein